MQIHCGRCNNILLKNFEMEIDKSEVEVDTRFQLRCPHCKTNIKIKIACAVKEGVVNRDIIIDGTVEQRQARARTI